MQENPWKINDSRLVYENPWISLTEYQVINPAGGPGIYGKVHFKNLAVGVVPLDEEDNIWMVGQYRFTLDAYSWEIPEGGCLLHTDPLAAARRELKEETGMTAMHWEKLTELHLSNSVSDERAVIYLATGLEQGAAEPEETEQLVVRKFTLAAVFEMVRKFEITDSMTVAAIQQLRIRQLEKQLSHKNH